MSDADFVIATTGLTRYFGTKCAVDEVSLRIPRGSVTALLGRNGSGKSTLIRMLMGVLEPTRGAATVLGHDSQHLSPQVLGRIGYIAEGHPLFDWMRVRELGEFQKSFYPGTWDDRTFSAIVDHFHLSPTARAGKLSRGERAGVALALALAPQPELLVLDDPALGLDPVARRTLLEAMILVTRDRGRTILFSSHLLADVERVADRVAILDRSVLRASCSVDTFMSRVKRLLLRFPGPPPSLPPIPGLLQARRDDDNELRLTIANVDDARMEQLRAMGAVEIEELPISLEDAVIGYLGDRGMQTSLLRETGVAV
jgi:ABC-2 type transport system ATP-binding protein